MTQRFDGHITGLGTTSGTRVVVGLWDQSPHGAFADAMVERVDGWRTLLAPDPWVADLVSSTYAFDEILVVPVTAHRWGFAAGPLRVEWRLGRRAAVGWALRAVPRPIGRSESWARLCDPLARRLMPGVRTHGSAGGGRVEWYAASDAWLVTSADVSWEGQHLGALDEVTPPVRFGFGSAPRTPMTTRVTSFIGEDATTS